MNREQRRKAERSNRIRNKEALKRQITEEVVRKVEKSNNEMYRELEQRMIDQRVEAMFCSFALALHREFGFGGERCLRALNKTDEIMKLWVDEPNGLDLIIQLVEEEIGLRIELGDDHDACKDSSC